MLRKTFLLWALLTPLAACMGTGAETGSSPIASGAPMKTPTVGEFVSFLNNEGHQAKIKPSESGAPMLSVNEGGDNFTVQFFDCGTGGGLAARRCTGAEYSVSYPVKKKPTLAQINELNQGYRLAKAYVADNGDPGISMAINTGGAFGTGNLSDNLEWWITAMRQFEEDIGWN